VTDIQLYLANAIPALAVLLGILTNVIQWNAMNARRIPPEKIHPTAVQYIQ
jgi:hypothetical protein